MTSHVSDIKICYIGGASRGWAPKLMSDLALCHDIFGELVLYDIDRAGAERNVAIADVLFSHTDAVTSFSTRATDDPADALKGADFVVFSIEPGPTQMRYADLVIPEKYGILQTVGDTIGPGGLFRALRAVPLKAHYARLIAEHCPDAWVINYTNPMTLCTAALYETVPDIKAFGCCHEVFGIQSRLGDLVAEWFDVPKPPRHDIRLDISGVNHFTLATGAWWHDHDLMPRLAELIAREDFFAELSGVAKKRKEQEQWFHCDGLVAFDFLRRFGVLGAAGDRHLMEFVPWYLLSDAEIHRWGVIRTPFEWRVRRMDDHIRQPEQFKEDGLQPTDEEGVEQMRGILGLAPLLTNVNLPNTGQCPDLPYGHIVESYAHFGRDAVRPCVSQSLPPAAQELLGRVATVQQLTLQAALECDFDTALEALLLDPLTRLSTDDASAMLREALEYMRDMLPDWHI